jgi:hypothetical protein
MEPFAPSFAGFWPSRQPNESNGPDFDLDSGDTPTQQAALEDLAERVIAARTVV